MRELGLSGVIEDRIPPEDYLDARAYAGRLPPIAEREVEKVEEHLEEEPQRVLDEAKRSLGTEVRPSELRADLSDLKAALRSPETAIDELRAAQRHRRTAIDVPENFSFEGYDPIDIPLDPGSRKYETWGDWMAWLATWVAAKTYRVPKATFERHGERTFVYDLQVGEHPRIALFSDFGTGLPHSRYIAKQLCRGRFDALIHLGDVYYNGQPEEFRTGMIEPLRPCLATTPLYTLLGNHELYSGGHAFFSFMARRRQLHPDLHRQEGSYFALRVGERYQLVALDTDYFAPARFRDPELRGWFRAALEAGRRAGRFNILLTANEPHIYGSARFNRLYADLSDSLPLVDLWFWGNTHYCALFDRQGDMPIGSCIGHGGFPYHLSEYRLDEPPEMVATAQPVLWAERSSRYPSETKLRPECGNNGYCVLELEEEWLRMVYIDWMARVRCSATLSLAERAMALVY